MGRTNRLIIALLLVVALAFPLMSPSPALATQTTTVFADDFGSGYDIDNVTTWNVPGYADWDVDSDGYGQDAALRRIGSGSGPRYLRLRSDDSVEKHNISTAGLENIHLEYTWGQDTDDDWFWEDEDDGDLVVQWKLSSAGSWTTVNTHDLPDDSSASPNANSEDEALGASAENTSIDIRFWGDTNEDDDQARVDNIVVSGDVAGPTGPTVTIDQAAGQLDPTSSSPINFDVVFSESVTDFATGDVTLSGTAGATTATVTGSGDTYNVAVSGMTTSGTVIADILADVATGDTSILPNVASTSTDNVVTYYLVEDNPSLIECCGADIVLVLDSSDSMSTSDLATVKSIAHTFANAFLTNAENHIGVVEFDTNVVATLDLTNNATNINSAIDGIGHTPGGPTELTNWEAGLTRATEILENTSPYSSDRDDTLHPDLIIIISDGEPTTYGYPSSLGSYGGTEPDPEDISNAILAANAAKTSTQPIRIIYAGVSSSTTYGQLISGTNTHPSPDVSINTDCITADFGVFAGILAALAETCVTTCPTTTAVDDKTVTYNDSDQTVELTATVAGCDTVSEGTVTFTVKDGTIVIGLTVTLVPVSGGIASAPFTLPGGTGAGIYTIYAEYSGTVENFNPSSGSGKLTVEKASTTLRLRSWPNPSRQGWPVYFVAMVMSTSGMPTGTITFKDGGRIIGTMTIGAGSVKFIYHRFRAGNHLITAVYSGDDNFLGCTSNTLLQRVRRR